MEWSILLPAVSLFALACNLDTVLLAAGWAETGVKVSAGHSLLIAGLTTLVTWLSLLLGRTAGRALPPIFSRGLGSLTMLGIGLWFLLDWLRRPDRPEGHPRPGGRSPWGWVSLAAALAVNNAGAGVAAGVGGIRPGGGALANFAATLAALPLGYLLAGRLKKGWVRPLSGGLLALLGLWGLFL